MAERRPKDPDRIHPRVQARKLLAQYLELHKGYREAFEKANRGNTAVFKGQPQDGESLYIMSVDNYEKNSIEGQLICVDNFTAAMRVVAGTHRIATMTEINGISSDELKAREDMIHRQEQLNGNAARDKALNQSIQAMAETQKRIVEVLERPASYQPPAQLQGHRQQQSGPQGKPAVDNQAGTNPGKEQGN